MDGSQNNIYSWDEMQAIWQQFHQICHMWPEVPKCDPFPCTARMTLSSGHWLFWSDPCRSGKWWIIVFKSLKTTKKTTKSDHSDQLCHVSHNCPPRGHIKLRGLQQPFCNFSLQRERWHITCGWRQVALQINRVRLNGGRVLPAPAVLIRVTEVNPIIGYRL